MSSRPTWSTEQVPAQSELHRETLSCGAGGVPFERSTMKVNGIWDLRTSPRVCECVDRELDHEEDWRRLVGRGGEQLTLAHFLYSMCGSSFHIWASSHLSSAGTPPHEIPWARHGLYEHWDFVKEPNIQHSKTVDSLFYCQKLEYTFHLAVNLAYAKAGSPWRHQLPLALH